MEKLINDFKINFTKGDTYAIAVKFKKIAEDLRTAFFTVKENPDDEPLIQKSLGAGIDKIDDREYKKEKTYKVQIQASDTANLEANVQYLYDLRVTIDNVVKTVLSGVFVVRHSVTGITSTATETLEVIVDDEVETEILTAPATNGIEYEQDPVACAKIGDLTELATVNKETIVKAVNEVKNGVLSVDEAVRAILNGVIAVPRAISDVNGDAFHSTYAKTSDITGGAVVPYMAQNANFAKCDDNGDFILETYAKKADLLNGDLVPSKANSVVGKELFANSVGANTGSFSSTIKDGDILEFLIDLGGHKFFTKIVVKISSTAPCGEAFYVAGFGWRCADIYITSASSFRVGAVYNEDGEASVGASVYKVYKIS